MTELIAEDRQARAGRADWRKPSVLVGQGNRTVSFHERSWNSIYAYIKESEVDDCHRVELRQDVARLTVTLDIVGKHPEARESPMRPTIVNDDTHNLMNFAPAGSTVWAYSEGTRFMRNISFLFDGASVAALENDTIKAAVLTPRLLFFDVGIFHLAKLFEAEFETGAPLETLYADSLSLALLIRLVRLSQTSIPALKVKSGLSSRHLKQVKEYLSARLGEAVALQELASLTNLSRPYFCRAFRNSTGLTPYQWFLHARIEQAKMHLSEGTLPISEIALLVGFADQAHFSKVFRKLVGSSPALWRRETAK
ncbi:MAG: AraC family transcriptional regulator [Rhizobium sp.]|nr:MAG: AraC family transcriptional regulator [Rhizobium sp.]